MLIRLLPDQIARHWSGYIKESVRASMPTHAERSDAAMNNVLGALLASQAQCWVIRVDKKVRGVVTTFISVDAISKTRNLLLYSLLIDNPTPGIFRDIRDTLLAFAKGEGCSHGYAYVHYPEMVDIAEKLGASCQTIISFSTDVKN